MRKLKFIDKENQDLKQRMQEICEKFGEQITEMDEMERKRLLLIIDKELAEEQPKA